MPDEKKCRNVDSARVVCCAGEESEWHQLMKGDMLWTTGKKRRAEEEKIMPESVGKGVRAKRARAS